MTTDIDFDAHLARESLRFVEVLRTARANTHVPTCPDWDADDLLWHLGEVQAFWGTIVRDRITDNAEAEQVEAVRPDSREGLIVHFDQATSGLQAALQATGDVTPAWTWSDDHTVGFIRRRQAHEALIHRLDAELTTESRTSMDPALCTDGVDEVLRVMYGGAPPWGTFTPDDGTAIRLTATDTDATWLVVLGRFTGTDPADGSSIDESDLRVFDDDMGKAAAQINGTAVDLDCWLWHRPTLEELERTGDPEVLGAFASVVSSPIN